jgi:membrane protein
VGRIRPDKPAVLRRRATREERFDSWVLLINPDKLTLGDVYRLFMFSPTGNAGLEAKLDVAIQAGLGETLSSYFSASKR